MATSILTADSGGLYTSTSFLRHRQDLLIGNAFKHSRKCPLMGKMEA